MKNLFGWVEKEMINKLKLSQIIIKSSRKRIMFKKEREKYKSLRLRVDCRQKCGILKMDVSGCAEYLI